MERLALLVEQLDRAADELESNNSISARLALILVDNACELMVHQKCESLVRLDNPTWLGEPKYSKIDRRNALGQDFDKKVSFLKKHSIIENDEANFLREAHSLRNAAYHIGMTDDDISLPIATIYYQLACKLLPRLGRGFLSIASDPLALGTRFSKHFSINDDGPWFVGFRSDGLRDSLLSRASESINLGKILSKKLMDELDELEHQIQFIIKNDPRNLSEEGAIWDAQMSLEEMKQFDKLPFPHEEEYALAWSAMNKEVRENYEVEFRRIPFNSWRKSVKGISGEKNTYRALTKFSNFRRSKKNISEAIKNASLELDGWIQNEIDRHRGK